jgi:hypothetical protein
MKRILLTISALMIAALGYAALPANSNWEYRGTGSNNYGGGYSTQAVSPGIDYSQQDSTQVYITDLEIDSVVDTYVYSAETPFTADHVGNFINISTAPGAGTWNYGRYCILAVTASTATLDRSAGVVGSTGCVAYLGGALALHTDAILETMEPGNIGHVKYSTYTIAGAINVARAGVSTNSITLEGYYQTRGDAPAYGNQPTLTGGSYTLIFGAYWRIKNFRASSTGAPGMQVGTGGLMENIEMTATTNRAMQTGAGSRIVNCKITAPGGTGIWFGSNGVAYNNDIRNCLTGIHVGAVNSIALNNVISGCNTGINVAASQSYEHIIGNTIYGGVTPSTGIALSNSLYTNCFNNIVSSCAYGITYVADHSTGNSDCFIKNNDYYLCETNRLNLNPEAGALALDPQFVDAANGNFKIGTNLKAQGYSSSIGGTGNYLDIGALQREEAGTSGGQHSYGY